MAFEGYAGNRRQLRRSAARSLPPELQRRPEKTVGVGRPLTL
jgi:hypothetical protein